MSEFLELLDQELKDANGALQNTGHSERIAQGLPATEAGNYWAGYVDALNNIINEYAGPGDTN